MCIRDRLHGTGAARAAQDHLARLGKIEAHLLSEGKGVGHAHHARGKRHLVGELCSLALARAAKAVNLRGERLEDVADGLDITALV